MKQYYNLIDNIRSFFKLQSYLPIIPWLEKNIDLSKDISAQRSKLDFSLYPYQVEVLKNFEDESRIKTITVVAIEQVGKSALWIDGLLYRMRYYPGQMMIVYPSDSLAAQNNLQKLNPLLKCIPQFKTQLQRPKTYRQDRYAFSNNTIYFQGAGAKIVSKSAKLVIGDEIDAWPVIGKIDNVSDLIKRTRSYSSSISFFCCSPTEQSGKIWKLFLNSSRGYWTLRCQNCFEWTMRSCDIHNLQFESEYDEQTRTHIVKPQTIRLVCPRCGFEHTEDMKREMNLQGKYIHQIASRITEAPGYQIGALASQLNSLSWKNIATKQLQAGKRSDIQTQTTFDNSWRGLPYKRRTVVKEDFEKLKEHCWTLSEAPSMANVQMVFLVADTQDNRSVVGIFALDVHDNLYLIEAKQPQYLFLSDEDRLKINSAAQQQSKQTGQPFEPIETVEDMLNKDYLIQNGVGIKPLFGLIDRQGHRTNDVQYFASKNPKMLMYQGSTMNTDLWRVSDNNHRLYLANARHWKTNLIYYLYSQKKRRQNYLYFMPNVSDDVIKQIVCVKPDPSKKFGDDPANWQPEHGAQHDWWDVYKMAYLAVDIAIKSFRYDRFRFGKSPAIQRRFEKFLNKKQNDKSVKEKSIQR